MKEGQGNRVGADLTSGVIWRALVIFAVPMIAANIIQQMYGLVDLLIIGRFMGSTGTVGVSTGGEISDLLTMIAGAFGAAGQIYVAQLMGAREESKLKAAIGTLLSVMFVTAVICMAAVICFHAGLLRLLNCPEEAFQQASNYMIITALGFPFTFGYNAICGVLRGMGESKRPLLFIIIAATANIFLDLLLVIPLHMEAAGTAIATVMSQAASFLASFIYLYKNKDQFDLEMKPEFFRIRKEPLVVLFKLGIPQAVRSFFVRFSMLYVNSSVNAYGLVPSATNSVGNKLQTFLEVYVGATQQASSAMIGQNLGARKYDRAKKTVYYACGMCLCLAAITAVVINIIPKGVFGIFTNDLEVLDMGVTYLRILTVHLFISAITSTLQSMVIGSGFASLNFVIGIVDGVVCKIGLGMLFAYGFGMGIYGFWWGTAFSRLIPALICFAYLMSGKWKTRKLLTESA